MTTAAETVALLARKHAIQPAADYAEWFAVRVGEEIEGDETIDILVALKRAGLLSMTRAADLMIQHSQEIGPRSS